MKKFAKFLGAVAVVGAGAYFVKKYLLNDAKIKDDFDEIPIADRSAKTTPSAFVDDNKKDSDDDRNEQNLDFFEGDASVSVTKSDENGRNIEFRDNTTGEIMTREVFVERIEAGEYDGYYVRQINGVDTPVSKPSTSDLG